MDQLVASYLHDENNPISKAITIAQFKHRQELVEKWGIPTNSHLLEIGCGQGECSLVLATAVGTQGSVTAIDNADPTYGSPYTIGQSQSYIKDSQLGDRITFQQTDATRLLKGPSTREFDGAVLCHSLWYFDNSEAIRSLFQALAEAGTKHLYIAEYAFQGTIKAQVPHVLGAQAQKRLAELQTPQAYRRDHERNIRAAKSPQELVEIAGGQGWNVTRQGTITPGAETRDGYWESSYVLSDRFSKAIETEVEDEEGQAELKELVEKVQKAVEGLKEGNVENVRTMDVWWVELSLEVGQVRK